METGIINSRILSDILESIRLFMILRCAAIIQKQIVPILTILHQAEKQNSNLLYQKYLLST